jgi:hypothetical protein
MGCSTKLLSQTHPLSVLALFYYTSKASSFLLWSWSLKERKGDDTRVTMNKKMLDISPFAGCHTCKEMDTHHQVEAKKSTEE